jgi:molybdopterin/thiamine biosynthesis adenylyltransferase
VAAFADTHDAAVAAVDLWIKEQYPASERAEPWQIAQHEFEGTGWRLPVGVGVSLLIAVDGLFPYSRPKTAIFGPDAPKDAPHVERNLRLCVAGSGTTTDHLDPVGVVRYFVEDALRLISAIERGELLEDFRIDFQAYWHRSSTSKLRVQTIVSLEPPTRPLAQTYYNSQLIVADGAVELKRWISNFLGKPFDGVTVPSLLVWLDPLPVPSEYPATVAQLRAFLNARSPEVDLNQLLPPPGGNSVIIIAGPTAPGKTGSAAFHLRAPSASKVLKGFRPGRVPPTIVGAGTSLDRVMTTQVGAAENRLPTAQQTSTRDLRVAIIGCGSLGGGVARLLAQQGVSNLTLIDPDFLAWENIGRHELGAQRVGQNKAKALASQLLKQLPHLESVVGFGEDWRTLIQKKPELFKQVDVVVSATGDWASEAALSDLQGQDLVTCPVVYGWLERNAVAAHALALQGKTPCLRCGFGSTGEPDIVAANWWEEDNDPRCAGPTSPYGALDLSAGQNLVASLAIDIGARLASPPIWRIWTSLTNTLEGAGGFWSGRFRAHVGDPGMGGRLMAGTWSRRANCGCY